MSQAPFFAYAGARILARHGQRPVAEDWDRLAGVRDFGHYLQTTRDTGLEPFVRHISSSADGHEVERALLSAWRTHVQEVAGWQPEPWRPALHWLALLSELPALGHLLAGRPAPAWMAAFPVAGLVLRQEGADPRRVLAQGRAAPLVGPQGGAGKVLKERAFRHWRRLLPAGPGRYWPPLGGLEAALGRYLREVAQGSGDADGGLEHILVQTLRRHTQEPAAAYAYLGLVALDLQRLRGDLLRRRLLPEQAA